MQSSSKTIQWQNSARKTFAPLAYGFKTFSSATIKISKYAKEFSAIFFAFNVFAHVFRRTPNMDHTNRQHVSHKIIRTKIIPPTLCIECDYVIQFNFTIAHILGRNNTTIDYLSRLEISAKKKLVLGIREDLPTTLLVLNVQVAEATSEDKSFFTEET